MREPIRDEGRLEHIMTAIENVFTFGENITVEMLREDKLRYYAMTKNIEIIGEAAYMLSQQFKDSHPGTDWKSIVGMRHALVHGYYQIDCNEVIAVMENDLPELKTQIQQYLAEFTQGRI